MLPILHKKSQACFSEDNKFCSHEGSDTFYQSTEKFSFNKHIQLKLVAIVIIYIFIIS